MQTQHSTEPSLLDHSLQLRWSLPVLALLAALPLLATLAGELNRAIGQLKL